MLYERLNAGLAPKKTADPAGSSPRRLWWTILDSNQ